ncbi:hypothetical protein NBT14_05910 [Weissella paramesenteroides]|nr:hypothetical protein [Weissella paramesenteroides]MDF8373627.1 hypothetical protein [Weissella paramesenteroides]
MFLLSAWFTHFNVAWLALAISLITLILKIREYKTKLSISNIYVTEIIGNTQKIILMLSNESSHPVSVIDLAFETFDLEVFKPKFGNYPVWSSKSYVRYTDILPVTFAPNESKLLIFEIDNAQVRRFSQFKISTVNHTFKLEVPNQSNISLDKLTTIR